MVSDLTIVAPTVSQALLYHRNQVPVYAYAMSLAVTPSHASRAWLRSYHSMELNYVFGCPFIGFNTDDGTEQTFSDADRNASLLVMEMWSNFAKFGYVSSVYQWWFNDIVLEHETDLIYRQTEARNKYCSYTNSIVFAKFASALVDSVFTVDTQPYRAVKPLHDNVFLRLTNMAVISVTSE